MGRICRYSFKSQPRKGQLRLLNAGRKKEHRIRRQSPAAEAAGPAEQLKAIKSTQFLAVPVTKTQRLS